LYFGLYTQAPPGPNNEQGPNAARQKDVSKILAMRFFGSENLGNTAYNFFKQVDEDKQMTNIQFTGYGMEVPPGALAPRIGVFRPQSGVPSGVLVEYVSQNQAFAAAKRYEQENNWAAYLNPGLKTLTLMLHGRGFVRA